MGFKVCAISFHSCSVHATMMALVTHAWGAKRGRRTSAAFCEHPVLQQRMETIGKRWLTRSKCLLCIKGQHRADENLLAKKGNWRKGQLSAYQWLACSSQSVFGKRIISWAFFHGFLPGIHGALGIYAWKPVPV